MIFHISPWPFLVFPVKLFPFAGRTLESISNNSKYSMQQKVGSELPDIGSQSLELQNSESTFIVLHEGKDKITGKNGQEIMFLYFKENRR